MERGILTILPLVCLCVCGLPNRENVAEINIPNTRNTIFGDERLPGEIFEDVDAFSNADLIPMNENSSPFRLPNSTRPIHYNILWTINLAPDPATVSGTVEIQLRATRELINEIVIHSDGMNLSRVELTQGTTLIPTNYEEDTTHQLLRVHLVNGNLNYNDNPANPIIYTLRIDFQSTVRNEMNGIYRSWYRNNATDGIRSMASTHFQATAARWAFPCYDEPSFKATFDVTIRREISHQSWFCTRLKETIPALNTPGFMDDVFHTTPVMSTYLLALIVAEYDSLRINNSEDLLVYEVIARPGAISTGQGQYALDVGQELLKEMSSHTDYDFYSQHPQLKMTQAAIPDFSAGAMENWGLLVYREAYLMYDENETNSHFKQRIAFILSHEIAHMWFGNLVTCDWWDNFWLNEGFARYYQYFLTYWVEDMGFATRFIVEQVHTALLADSANNPHPLTNPGLYTNVEVRTMFSTISYNKGASVIRMTEHLLGFEVNRRGLRNYLVGREFTTALPIHLFEYLEQAGIEAGVLNYGSNFSFIDYYKSWTEQPGHPVLSINVNHETGDMAINQRRFNINTGYSSVTNNYIVPITFATASNPNFYDTKPSHILSQADTIINRGTVGDEWVIFNKQQTGFYRVNYDDYTWDLITIALKSENRTMIHEYNRAQIVDDLFQFARSGIMTYTRALSILSFLENETEYAPWLAAMTGFTWLRNRLASTTTITQLVQLNARIAQWASRVMASLTYYPDPNEPFMRSYLRLQLAPVMCSLGVQDCITAAQDQFRNLLNNNIPVPVDNRNWVYCTALRTGVASDFDYLWKRFQEHNVYSEKILILENLGCTKDAASLNTFMNAIVNSNYIIRPQDYTTAFNSAVSGNEENTEIALKFIQDNLLLVASAFSDSVATPLSYVTARLRSIERIEEFRTWARDHQELLGNDFNTAMAYANSARASIEWAESVKADISNYLENGTEPPTTSTEAPTTTQATAPTFDPVTIPEITNTAETTTTQATAPTFDPVTIPDITNTAETITTQATPPTFDPVTIPIITTSIATSDPTTSDTTTTDPPTTTELVTGSTPSSATTSSIATSLFLVSIIILY